MDALVRGFLEQAGVLNRLSRPVEERRGSLRRPGGTWGPVFSNLDGDAGPDTLRVAWALLRPGGLSITDNVM